MIYQSQEKGCGYASVKMLMEEMGLRNAERLPEPVISKQAPSLGELIAYAEARGLLLAGYQFLEPSGLARSQAFPLLLLVKEGGKEHLVMAKAKRRRGYLVCDPKRGKIRVDEKEMGSWFTGIYLKPLSFDPKKAEAYLRPLPKKVKGNPFLYFIPFLETLVALGVLSCLRREGSFLLLSLFLALYFLLWAGRNFLFLSSARSFDREYSSRCLAGSPEERESLLRHYCAYKKVCFAPMLSLIENACAFLLLGFLLVLNEPLFALLILIPLSFSLLSTLFLAPRRRKQKESIAEKEKRFAEEEMGQQERMALLEELLQSGQGYAKRDSFLNTVLVLLCAFSAGLAMAVGPVSSNRFLFCLFASLSLMKTLCGGLNDLASIRQERKERPYFRFHFQKAPISPNAGENDRIHP